MTHTIEEFIDYICKSTEHLSIILGAGNVDLPNKGIYDKTRFSEIFDFAV